ncbi:hypothetical protein [Psychromonas sp. L1A2]|uniref:hypothetical protein n=1 Tax=Psychromonas sp. L1A2 TaxID=2686356 RepID=UPI001356F41F|nr:hypothetical protein [Psychromonas sp. L1A2]
MLFKGYVVNHQHRGGLPINKKSQWTIPEWKELTLFHDAKMNEWKCNKDNLWSADPEFCKIGRDINNDLFIAKFKVDQGIWHGYPVSPKAFDIPPKGTLKDWVVKNIVSKRDAVRIEQGKY